MAAPAQRTGPLLRVEGSCEGCEHFRRDLPPVMWGIQKTTGCAAQPMSDGRPRWIAYDGDTATPAWCPELHAATVEHAQAVLAKEGES